VKKKKLANSPYEKGEGPQTQAGPGGLGHLPGQKGPNCMGVGGAKGQELNERWEVKMRGGGLTLGGSCQAKLNMESLVWLDAVGGLGRQRELKKGKNLKPRCLEKKSRNASQ